MPIRFQCQACGQLLSIATRKAGTRVECPKCGSEVTVPGGEPAPVPRSRAQPAVATQARPAAVSREVADPPLFERSDFDRLLEPDVRRAAEAAKREPPSVAAVVESPATGDGIYVSRGALVVVGFLTAVLVVLAFVVGFLVGS